jgi:transcriptional regulator with XRE-family HTH domain
MQNEFPGKIKQYRTEKKLTLEQLGLKAGCTKSYISQLERGLTLPSLSMLARLADALGISVSVLFSDLESRDKRDWHLRKAARRKIIYPDKKVLTELLTTAMFQKKMQPIISVIEPGGTSDISGMLSHPAGSEEFVLVLKGEIDFEINKKQISLREGDTVYFNGDLPHRWVNNGKGTAEVLFVFTPPIW